ncbi:hypothetical protein NHX12_027879 [Muraenolepis orangiensis]|uniref:Uncharacterized protein n=1 Tax=Muraenolepis orangiensis TaxID=630683 RepID=A0A9Q0EEK7_9TELE|nr:hypothetical protein NHX12_027879 [Muraenolepis orangiensis]
MPVTNQPGRYPATDFQTGLFDCASDCSTCMYGLFCYPCLGCSIAGDMGEFCLCGTNMAIRSVYRTKYNINWIMAVTNQPGRYPATDFQTGLLDCGSDCSTCMYGLFCYPCLGCSIAGDMGEFCLCGTGMAIRSVYRTKYNINGSMCNDYMTYVCCSICGTCQLKRDIELRKEQGTF